MIFIKKKNLNSYFCIIHHFEMLDYNFNEFVLIYSLYFVCYYLFRGIFKKINIGFMNLRIV